MIAVVDLFCGGGGFSEGAIQAGAQVVLSIDAWHPAVIAHRLNHPNTPCLKFELGGSIESVAALIKMYLPKGCHFHLHASPPCQALSNASRANAEDGLGLVDWVLELVEYMKPDSWSLENVLPLGKFLTERKVPFVNLNAAHYGVPQTRKRVFAGEGWTAKESHSKEQFVSVIEALPHLKGELQIVSRRRKKGENPQAYSPTKPAHTITRLPGVIEEFKLNLAVELPSADNWVLNMAGFTNSYGRRAVSSDVSLSLPSKTLCSQRPTIRLVQPMHRKTGVMKSGRILKPLWREMAEPAYTVTGTPATLGHLSAEPIITPKPQRIRSLTLNETAILQGWHDMKMPENIRKKDAWQIIGNMVCPAVAKAIIEGIKEE